MNFLQNYYEKNFYIMNPKERLKEYLQHKGISVNAAEKKLGMSKGYIGNWKGNVRESFLLKIIQTFPDLDKVWLLTGEGEMLNQNVQIGDGTNIAGDKNNVNEARTVEMFLKEISAQRKLVEKSNDEISAQRRLVEKSQEQIDRLIKIIEKSTEK